MGCRITTLQFARTAVEFPPNNCENMHWLARVIDLCMHYFHANNYLGWTMHYCWRKWLKSCGTYGKTYIIRNISLQTYVHKYSKRLVDVPDYHVCMPKTSMNTTKYAPASSTIRIPAATQILYTSHGTCNSRKRLIANSRDRQPRCDGDWSFACQENKRRWKHINARCFCPSHIMRKRQPPGLR